MEWISIKDRLPGKSERVILHTPYHYFGQDQACIGTGKSIPLCSTTIDGRRVPVFTYWMPLPAAPGNGSVSAMSTRTTRKNDVLK